MPCETYRDEKNDVTAIVCREAKRCSYCERPSAKPCDFEVSPEKTCDAPLCSLHTYTPEPGKDYCRMHRRKLQEPEREAKRKAELEAMKRDTLIFFAQSKYSGWCREKDCGAKWQQGEPCYWDSKTREVFCVECGELMSSY